MSALARLRDSLPAELPPALASLAERLQARPKTQAAGPIGFELGPDALHLVQLERRHGALHTRAARTVPYPDGREACLESPAAFKALFGGALQAGGFRGRHAVGALRSPDVKLMVIDYAAVNDAEEPRAIVQLVGERFDEAPEALVIDYLPIRALQESRSERSALVAVAHRDLVIPHLERLRAAGLEIDALEIAPVATRRLVEALAGTGPEDNALALYAGRDSGHLCVLWGRRLVLYRELGIGEKAVVERLAKTLELESAEAETLLFRHGVQPPGPGEGASEDPATTHEIAETTLEILKPGFYALAEQIDRARVYTASKAHGAEPDRVYLLGAFARWPRADRLLASLTEMDVHTLDPSRDFAPASDDLKTARIETSPESALATGLALRGMLANG